MAQTFAIRCFESVNNPNLPKLGEVRFQLNDVWDVESNPKAFEIRMSTASTIRTSAVDMWQGGGGATNIGRTGTIISGSLNYFWFKAPVSGYAFIDNYQAIQRIDNSDRGVFKIRLEQLSECSGLNYLNGGGSAAGQDACTGNIASIPNADNFLNLGLYGPKVVGSLTHFSDATLLQNIRLWTTGVTGRMSDLSKCVALTRLSTTSSGIENDWQTACDGMVANGRTSGSCRFESFDGDLYVDFDPAYTGGWQVRT